MDRYLSIYVRKIHSGDCELFTVVPGDSFSNKRFSPAMYVRVGGGKNAGICSAIGIFSDLEIRIYGSLEFQFGLQHYLCIAQPFLVLNKHFKWLLYTSACE